MWSHWKEVENLTPEAAILKGSPEQRPHIRDVIPSESVLFFSFSMAALEPYRFEPKRASQTY